MARNIPGRRSRAMGSPGRGLWPSMETTTSGFPISRCPTARSRSSAENCPPGFKTGDQISPRGGYVGGGLQMQVDVAISPSGDVWVTNNWQDIDSCYRNASEALSTRCGGQGAVIFFGMAKPVRSPQIGPAQPL